MPILGDFAVKYGSRAAELGVPTDDLYQALVDTAENTVSPFRTYIFIHGARQLLPCIVPSLLIGMKVCCISFIAQYGVFGPNPTSIVGRQNTAWKMFDYIPTDWTDPSGATGLPTREASRTLEVGHTHQSSFSYVQAADPVALKSMHLVTLPYARLASH